MSWNQTVWKHEQVDPSGHQMSGFSNAAIGLFGNGSTSHLASPRDLRLVNAAVRALHKSVQTVVAAASFSDPAVGPNTLPAFTALWRSIPMPSAAVCHTALPNPSLEWTSTGKALGPRGGQAYHPPRGPSALPVASAQLKR